MDFEDTKAQSRYASERDTAHPDRGLYTSNASEHGPRVGSTQQSTLKDSRARVAFLVEAGRLLSESLDYESILQRVADATIPTLADWTAVDVVHPSAAGEWPPLVRRVAVSGRDPARLAWARAYGAEVERDWTTDDGLAQVLRTGDAAFFPEVTDDAIRNAALSEQEKQIFLRIGLRSAMCVPLVARGRTFGAISLGMSESGRQYDEEDLALAGELARHAAIAIDNARLYADEHSARVAAERAALRLERLQHITAALSHARTPAQVGEVIVGHGIEALGASGACVYVAGDAGTALDLVCAAGHELEALDPVRRIAIHASHPAADALRARVPIFVSTVAEMNARYPHLAGDRDTGAWCAVPLVADERGIGAILFDFPGPLTLGADERALLGALAHQCAQATDRARLFVAETRAKDAVVAVQRRQAAILEAIADGFVTFDREWRYSYVNRVAAELLGIRVEDLVGRVLWDMHPGNETTPFSRALQDAMASGTHASGESYSNSIGRWIEYRAYPTEEGLSVVFRDIDERRRHDERLRFLAEASTLLSSSLDYETTLANIAELAVPAVASSCVIDLVGDDNGALERVATVFDSGELSRLVGEFRKRHPIAPSAHHPSLDVLATGATIFFPEITPDVLPLVVDNRPDSIALARRLNPTSCVFVALNARGRTLGVMSLSTSGNRRRFDDRDRVLIEDLAQRVAMAVDNARLHEDERRSRAQAEAANQAKSDFLAIMSHELRTPLTAVVGYTELLADEVVGPVNDTQKDHLLRVRASSEHLLMLIEDILSFARIEAGREQVRIEDFGLAALLEQAAVIVRPLAEKKNLGFKLAGQDLRAVMRSDPQKVRQIIINLLANAVKFTTIGGVELRAHVDADRVQFEVSDTGPGIAPEHVDRVFDAFWQVDQRMTRKAGGTGLGLSVVRQLARLLGGDATLRSTVGEGSVFIVDLPLAAPYPEPDPA